MFPNYLIGLREGLEAALVVSILLTYLVQTKRHQYIKNVWQGVIGAVLFSAALGGIVFAVTRTLSEKESEVFAETFAGAVSLIAVALVTWMIIWMRDTGRKIAAELKGKLEQAIKTSVWMIVIMAFVAVAREGLETALFFYSAVQATGSFATPAIGFSIGLATAILLGWLIYRGSLKLNLKKFFTVTGYFLIFVAAGVLTYAIHEFQEVGIIPGLNDKLYDISAVWSVETFVGSLAKGIFNFSPTMSLLEAAAWALYVGITIWVFSKNKKEKPAEAAKAPTEEKVNA